jgi:hypothetical protein
MEYRKYLASAKWRKIRKRVLKRDGYLCRGCGSPATEVHHGSYAKLVMLGGADHWLYSLCRKCHESISFNAHGRKRLWAEVQEMTRALDVQPRRKAARPAKPHREPKRRMTPEQIRERSRLYAEGRMP